MIKHDNIKKKLTPAAQFGPEQPAAMQNNEQVEVLAQFTIIQNDQGMFVENLTQGQSQAQDNQQVPQEINKIQQEQPAVGQNSNKIDVLADRVTILAQDTVSSSSQGHGKTSTECSPPTSQTSEESDAGYTNIEYPVQEGKFHVYIDHPSTKVSQGMIQTSQEKIAKQNSKQMGILDGHVQAEVQEMTVSSTQSTPPKCPPISDSSDDSTNIEGPENGSNTFSRGSFNSHKKGIHNKKRDLKCGQCSYETRDLSNMKRHIKGVHDKVLPFRCNICTYATHIKGDLVRHKNTAKHKHTVMMAQMKQQIQNYTVQVPSSRDPQNSYMMTAEGQSINVVQVQPQYVQIQAQPQQVQPQNVQNQAEPTTPNLEEDLLKKAVELHGLF